MPGEWRQKVFKLIDDLEERTKDQVAYVTGKGLKPASLGSSATTMLGTSPPPPKSGAAKNWGKARSVMKMTNLVPAQLGASKSKRLSKQQRGRSVRVFVSSTFRDFAKERDYLNAHVFPVIKQHCERRGVFFAAIDLRWGVTAEESGRGDVIKLCLQQIDACYPFFIGMLGDRYGWHLPPTESPWIEDYEKMNYLKDDLLETTFEIGEELYPWVKQHRKDSVTEIELRHAVLNDLKTTGMNASFYLRDTASFKKNEEVPEGEHKTYAAETKYAAHHQEALREEILKNERFPVLDGYRNLKEIGDEVLKDLIAFVDLEFPADENLTEVDLCRVEMESFAHTRMAGYVKRQDQLDQIDTLVTEIASEKHGEGAICHGESGCGKTCLMCCYALQVMEMNPEAVVFLHVCSVNEHAKVHTRRKFSSSFPPQP